MKAMRRTSSMTKLASSQENMKSQPIWSESILAQLESIAQENNISSNYSIVSCSSDNKSQQSNQWNDSTLAAGMVVEEKEERQAEGEIPIITPISSEEEETKSPSSLSPCISFTDEKEKNTTSLKTDPVSSSSKKPRKQQRNKAKKHDDDDAQSVASNISRLRAKQKLLRLHSANKLAESRRRLSLQQQSMSGYQYLSNRDASSVTSRTTISEWSTMHQTPVHRRSSIPRQVLISESGSLYDLRQSPVHESKDALTVATESERILQERLSKVQDELVGTKQMMKLLFAVLILTAMGLIFRDDMLHAVQHARLGKRSQAPTVFVNQMHASTMAMDPKSIPQLSTDEPDCIHQGGSCVNSDSEIIRSAVDDAESESLSKSKAQKKAILDRAQRILKSKANACNLDTRNPDYIGLLLSN